jgi:hypothetical protein
MQTSATSRAPQRVEDAAWRREPTVLRQVLDAVSAVNSQLLDALVESARTDAPGFPLNESLRRRVARLGLEERRRSAGCRVFLVDANFVEFSCWREMALPSETARSTETLPPWLPIEESRSLAYSALLLAWYVIHADPVVARVLLGMSASGVLAYRKLTIGDLAQLARCRPDCVRPRWPTRADVWAQLIEEAGGAEPQESRSGTLRCLEVSLGDLNWLSAYVEPSV